MIGMGTISVSNIKNGKDGATGMGIESTYVQYCYGASGTNPPGEYLVDENGNYLVDQNGNYFTNGQWRSEVPKEVPGLFLWSKTVTVYEDGTESVMYSLGKEGTGIISEKRLYYLSSSMDGLQDGFWTEEQPYPIPDGYYLWGRYEFIMSDGSVKYTNPIYEKTLSGVISEVDNANLQIRNQVWKTDITNMIGEWDTTNEVTTRIASSVTDIDGIWTSITNENQKTVTKADGTTVTTIASKLNEVKSTADEHTTTITQDILGDGETSLKSIATQTADHLAWIISDGTDAASMTLTSTALSIIVRDINLQGRVSFSDLKSDVGSKVNLATSWTEVNVDPNVTTINGGFIRSHTIVAEHLNTNAIKSFGKYNAQTGKYKDGYDRDPNATYSTTGSFFDMENGNIFTPSFSIINTIPTGETLTKGGYFKGTITASGGSIGGWTIEEGILYSGGKTPSSTSIILKPGGIESNVNIGGSNPKNNTNVKKNWALTIKDDFGVTTDGYMYATNANISGVITATSGVIGGINIDSLYGIYTKNKTAADSEDDGYLISNTGAIYIGPYDKLTKQIPFSVNPNGYVKAYNIEALGGKIGEWNINSTMLYYGSDTPSTSSIILAPKGNDATMYFYDGNNKYTGAYKKNWAITAGGGFGVTTSGEVFCSNAHVSGEIYATAGEIGGCVIEGGILKVDGAEITNINADYIASGAVKFKYMDFSELENLDALSHYIGDYLELGENSGFMFEYDEDSGDAYLCYGKTSFDDTAAGFYLGTDGLSIGEGDTTYGNPFSVSSEGVLKVKGEVTANVLKMYLSDSDVVESQFIKAQAVESFGASVRIGQSTTTGSYIDISYSTKVPTAGQGSLVSPGTIQIGAPEGVYIGTSNNYSHTQIYGSLTISGTSNGESNSITAGNGYIDKLYTKYLYANDSTSNRITVQGYSFDDRGDIEANDFYARNNYRIFYWKDSSHPNETVQCIESNTPSNFGSPKGVSGTQKTWLRFGSTSSYNCMAMPVNGSSIYFRVKSSSDSSYTWYNLKTDIIDKLGTGGGGYSAGTGITIDSDKKININTTWMSNNYAAKSHSHSEYAASNHTHSGYASSTHSHSEYAEKTNSNQVILAKQLKATTSIYMENVRHAATTSATWVSAGSTQPSGMSDAYRLYLVGSSSKRYKDHLGLIDIDYASRILDIPVVKFKYKDGYLADDDEFIDVAMPGFYAEDVEAAIPEAVFHQNGKVENWIERHIIPLMLRVIQDQQKRIEELEKKLAQ